MSVNPNELSEAIRQARESRKWSQKELADRAGIGKTAMFDLEHGNPGVRLNTLQAVLAQLGMELQLIRPETRDTPPTPEPTTENLPDHLL